MTPGRRILSCGIVLLLAVWIGAAEEPSEELGRAWLERRAPKVLIQTGMPMSQARAMQGNLVRILERTAGKRVGYKVGLVTKAGQERMKLKGPVSGVLLEGMLLTNNVIAQANYGVRPILEADLIVTIKDSKINRASTVEELADSLGEIVCFIELADGLVTTNQPMDGGVLTALNVGARAGILGERKAVSAIPAFTKRLEEMRFVLKDGKGHVLSDVQGKLAMENPLNALLWLIKELQNEGGSLRPGDLVSLGSPSPQVVPRAGESYELSYENLFDGKLSVKVHFKNAPRLGKLSQE